MGTVGPLLRDALLRMGGDPLVEGAIETMSAEVHIGMEAPEQGLPVVVKAKDIEPRRGEAWKEYKDRAGELLQELNETANGGAGKLLYSANSVAGQFDAQQAVALADHPKVSLVELDPILNPLLMDDVVIDVALADFRNSHGGMTGEGIRVAVLDSGIDTLHPYLEVSESVSVSDEGIEIPGSHGTHCAGSIASRDPVFQGLAPAVTLLNIKVLTSLGSGRHTQIAQGIDEALDREADILSMSIGFNHLPAWSDRGHGWSCPDGRCPLCTAVDNAAGFGATVIVAAGNEHDRAENLRRFGQGGTFDTEFGCPGQARGAITIGAITKTSFNPASFTSRGPTSYGEAKPQLSAPGVNIMSTIPAPRRADGTVDPNPPRANLFGRKSGTSMATPIVAGAAALIMQDRRARGLSTRPRDMRDALEAALSPLAFPADTVGRGRIDLAQA